MSIQNPEVAFLEDETNGDSLCIGAKCAFLLRGHIIESTSQLELYMNRVEIAIFQMADGKKVEEISCFVLKIQNCKARVWPILNPLNCQLHCLIWEEHSHKHEGLRASTSPAELFVSYRDFKLIMDIIESLLPLLQPIRKLLHIKKFKSASQVKEDATTQQLDLHCGSICMTIINDFRGQNTPVLEMRVSEFLGVLTDWLALVNYMYISLLLLQPHFAIEARVAVDFFNSSLMCYEPLFEHYSFSLQVLLFFLSSVKAFS